MECLPPTCLCPVVASSHVHLRRTPWENCVPWEFVDCGSSEKGFDVFVFINELYFVEKVFNNHWYSMERELFVLNLGHLIDVATGVKGKSTKCPRSGIVWNCVVCDLIDFIQSHERQSNLNLKSFFCSFCTPSLCHLRIAEHKHQCEKARQRSVEGSTKI